MDNEKQDSLIPYIPAELSMKRVGNLMKITDGLLLENNKLFDFCLKHPKFFLKLICVNYCLNEQQLLEYDKNLFYASMSRNENLLWNDEIIKRYKNKWNWLNLFHNESITWSNKLIDELISEYKDKWDLGTWTAISFCKGMPWSIDFIEKYAYYWDWEYLSKNEKLPWNTNKYGYLVTTLIEKFNNRNWKSLSENKGIPWSIELIEKYKENWIWTSAEGLSYNESLPWTIELIEKYKEKWKWSFLSHNKGIPWSIELIEKFKENWAWSDLSRNTWLPWTEELIEKYKDKWFWVNLSRNTGINWTEELIEKYNDKFKLELYLYEGCSRLSIKSIEKNIVNLDWNKLSKNFNFKWTLDLVEKNKDKLDWSYLVQNKELPWTLEFLEKFEDKWDWSYLFLRPFLWDKVFKDNINDVFIKKIIDKIK